MTAPKEVVLTTLADANRIRVERAEYKRKVKCGDIDPVGAILTCRVGMPAIDLVRSFDRFGRHKALKVFEELKLNADTLIMGEPTFTQKSNGQRDATRRERLMLSAHIQEVFDRRAASPWNRKAA